MTTADAIDEIWAILAALPSPREAARALAGAHVMLMEAQGSESEAQVRICLKESAAAILDAWAARTGVTIAQ
jgi:hypothetical protein